MYFSLFLDSFFSSLTFLGRGLEWGWFPQVCHPGDF